VWLICAMLVLLETALLRCVGDRWKEHSEVVDESQGGSARYRWACVLKNRGRLLRESHDEIFDLVLCEAYLKPERCPGSRVAMGSTQLRRLEDIYSSLDIPAYLITQSDQGDRTIDCKVSHI